MKNLKELYLKMTRLPESGEYKNVAPVKIFDLVTRCAAVRAKSAAALNRAEKEAFITKETLMSDLRECLDTGKAPEAREPYDPMQVHKVAALLLNSKAAGYEARIKPKFTFREGFHTWLVGSMDLILRENDLLTLVRLSQAAHETDADETAVLMYMLLAMLEYEDEESVVFKRIPVVKGDGKELAYRLDGKDLTEDIEVTLKKIIDSLVETQRDKGSNCAECIHAPYCPVLKQTLEQEALNAAVRDQTERD